MKLFKNRSFQILLLLWWINSSLESNKAYYAQHMPREEGRYPEYILLMDDIGKSFKEIPFETIDGGMKPNFYIYQGKYHFSSYDDKYIISEKESGDYHYYLKNGRLDYSIEELLTEDYQRGQRSLEVLKEIYDPILEEHRNKPFINLQWLFNLKYYERFNGKEKR